MELIICGILFETNSYQNVKNSISHKFMDLFFSPENKIKKKKFMHHYPTLLIDELTYRAFY